MAAKRTKISPSPTSDSVPSFEESMQRLQAIVSELEEGELTLEESLERFEEGVRLARSSQARLDEAEARVEQLLGEGDDGPETEEMNVS